MASKNYCWSMGTTSFRTSQLNYKIEKQLKLIEEFWKQHPDMKWNQPKTKDDIEKLNMSKDERYPVQVLYYNYLKDNQFLVGNASLRDKDARAKTSGLVDLGLLNDERKITDVGYSIMNTLNNQNNKNNNNNIFNISDDSYYYLLQFLKLQINNHEFKIKPFIALLYMIQQLDYLSFDEFTYLLPLCKNHHDVIKIVDEIKTNRIGLDIDNIIETKLFDNRQYLKMLDTFINTSPVTEETFELIGMSGKSKQYDKNYKQIYDTLVDLVFHLKNKNIDERINKYNQLFDYCNKISGNAKKHWKNYLFFGYRKNNFDEEFDKKFKQLEISTIRNIKDFKKFFFSKMHITKCKINLKDYFDLNRRYFSLTDIIKFGENRIELDILPKYYFKNIVEDLINEDILDNEIYKNTFGLNSTIEEVLNKNIDISTVINTINHELNTNLTINSIGTYLQDEKIKNFNKLIEDKFREEDLIKLFDLIKQRNDDAICEYVTDNADVPTIFEYLLGIAWYRISNKEGNILEFMNLSLDADLLPKTHAGGGMADIVYEYNEKSYPKHNLLIEATLSESTGQRHMEMEPVSRHLGEDISKTNNENDYVLFVAPDLEERVILDFRNMKTRSYPKANGGYTNGLKIIPINTDILKKFITEHRNYEDLYSFFDRVYKSTLPDPEWFDKEILQNI